MGRIRYLCKTGNGKMHRNRLCREAFVFPRNGGGEVSPQIPSYIRVKDDSVKVSNVKTYLVKKLGLASEAEVEITCMGQNLLPSQTLKEVRDTVWFPGLMQSLNVRGTPSAGTELLRNDSMYHILTMDYQRRGSSDSEE
ncbi:hypothetical protein MRB53_034690 [Persea americana]|uniref:Uncharacterized protein n=1 Tax=Persea americana TaxID=3435 RepID=A0ACC2K2U8_PERAE|nr:hypothetical protein MRB53_034690 [Persea americana]|eukprot:TRINITY_DN45048_c0_g1_i1.p1 TRINITY_DN45048_c0_g1~~TRINITY_DN45048_c0_g1_i1.p1  ORF type:complete len:139 (-),score=9.15 TRINITY_DN45048_c0_g1_i1:97-513(-)